MWWAGPWLSSSTYPLFFFFQAEDGIRDTSVTGVQTCALPIFHRLRLDQRIEQHAVMRIDRYVVVLVIGLRVLVGVVAVDGEFHLPFRNVVNKIGRASCRERV